MEKKIGLGTWSWGNKFFWNYQQSDDLDLLETYQESIKRGFSYIDTADSYGTGRLAARSEKLLGKFLLETSNAKKNKIKIATKLAPYPWRLGRKGFNKPFFNSLERLNNKLDIVQLHWSTSRYNPIQEEHLLENLCNLIDQGFDFQIGLSNIGPEKLEQTIDFLGTRSKQLKSVQVQFSLLSPELEKQKKIKEICENYKIDFLAYSPLAFGLLCKNPNERNNKSSSFLRNLIFQIYDKSTFELRNVISEIANRRSVSLAQVAVNWCCYQGAIPIIGLRKKSQVIDIAGVFNWNLNFQEFRRLENASMKSIKKMPKNPFTSD